MVSNTYKTVAVADGVGGWRATHGEADPGRFANALMRNAKLYSETHRTEGDALRVLTNAYEKVRRNREVGCGGSTGVVGCLRPGVRPGRGLLDVANVGDSGAMLIRNQEIVHRAHEKVHGLNAPFQLSVLPEEEEGGERGDSQAGVEEENKGSGKSAFFHDSPKDAVRELWEVQEGDVLVMGTDGLFDNLWSHVIAEKAGTVGFVEASSLGFFGQIPVLGYVLKKLFSTPNFVYTDPFRVVQGLVSDAYVASHSADIRTPFSVMLSHLLGERRLGGKPDDITVLLSRIVRRDELKRMQMW